MKITGVGQYKSDIFEKLDIAFTEGSSLLDVGAGDCSDALIFKNNFKLNVSACDVYEHENAKAFGLDFKIASVLELPYADSTFNYIFLHDVLHHVDEENQSYEKHKRALQELKRVLKTGGQIIIVEGNRYNPLFYPHMVKMRGHNHFTQRYFVNLINSVLTGATFKFFEAHLYPTSFLKLFKLYERLMESLSPNAFLAYNVAIWKKN